MVNTKEQTKQNLVLLKIERDRLIEEIDTLCQLSTDVSTDQYAYDEFITRCSDIKSTYQDFIKSQNEVIKLSVIIDADTDLQSLKNTYKEVSKQYYVILTTLRKISGTEQSNSSTSSSDGPRPIETQVKLPTLQLPTFSGLIKDWPHFKDLYSSLIHDNGSISDIQKFQYLLSCLTEEPHNLARTLPVTAQNYPIVWEQLVSRYDDKRRLATYYLDEILNLSSINNESPKQLRHLLDICSENSIALTNMEFSVSLGDFMLFHSVVQKLDRRTRQLFESKYSKTDFPTFQNLLTFLRDHCKSLDAVQIATENTKLHLTYNKPSYSQNQPRPNSHHIASKSQASTYVAVKPKVFDRNRKHDSGVYGSHGISQPKTVMLSNSSELTCDFCQKTGHKLYHCTDFQSLTTDKRLEFAKGNSLCTNCLGSDHKYLNCTSKHLCFTCKRKHHTLLHLATPFNKPTQDSTSPTVTGSACLAAISPTTDSLQEICNTVSTNTTVVLGTTLVSLSGPQGQQLVCRAVLDSAASSSFITTNVADCLHIKRNHANLPQVCGISSTQISVRGISHVDIASVNGENLAVDHPVIILDKITAHLPRVQINPQVKLLLRNHILADPTFDTPASIDLLIGADLFAKTLLGNQLSLGKDLPIALNTIFGYVIIGQAPAMSTTTESVLSKISINMLCTHDLDLHNSIQKFWVNEEPPHLAKPSKEEEQCEQFFKDTQYRDATGRYVVRLPFKESPTSLGDSSKCAFKQFKSIEKSFESKPQLKEKYIEFMNDYKESGHMRLCDGIPSGSNFYLPHHGVFKGDKIRVVFNASATTTSNVSLNDILHSGVKLHNNIFDIMFNFRRYKVVFSCDIKQMFRQITIDPSDTKYQLIYWRDDPSHGLSVYELSTVTYGMSCSPYLANRVIQQLIDDEGHNYRNLSPLLRDQIYVDDILLGSDTVSQATKLQNDLIALLSKGGFELRKWVSSHEELLNHLPPEHCETSKRFFQSDHLNDAPSQLFSILGLKWLRDKDCFSYDIDVMTLTFTKRGVLSQIAKIYDVMGFLTPVVMWAKSFMQVIWSKGVTWDEPLSQDIREKWTIFIQQLPCIRNVQIQRHLPFDSSMNIQLHGFCDASQLGYGCCVYLRVEHNHGPTTIHLLLAKSRVAPLKQISLPRLELCGAHLLSKLLRYSYEQLSPNYEINVLKAWCDSTITISWIQTPSYKLKTYVANRVTEIQENVPSDIWHHIPSAHNPADCASRGLLPHALVDHDLWWNGPGWLKEASEHWPTTKDVSLEVDISDEFKKEHKSEPISLFVSTSNKEWEMITKFSSWTKLIHIMAFILRFTYNCSHVVKRTGQLSFLELKEATIRIIKSIQASCFSNDISQIKSNKPCSTALRKLNAFLDSDGVLRVGGRLCNSDLSEEEKHPAILPKTHYVVNLIIDFYHIKHLHVGPQQLQAFISQKFWILSARSIIRSRVHRCITCFRCRPSPETPFMGDLPKPRVTPSRPFHSSGCDFAGPFLVRPHRLRRLQNVKIYLCIFICMATKAVHIETVSDLTSEAFIAALTRFSSRRGFPSHLYTDCGTAFIGANRQLKTIFKELAKQPDAQRFAELNTITFHFIPPAAPHQGGLWERAVRSTKYHLKRVIGAQLLTMEEFITLTTKVEAILNSRPIAPLSSDPSELQPLTPGHFLVQGPLVSIAEPDFQETPLNRLRRWQMVQRFTQDIWTRWKREYLHTLQQRSKWLKKINNLQVDQLVIIHDVSPPMSWKLGRIISTSPGPDGVVRVVKMKTMNGTVSRPVVKVSPLPL